jgi:hypothetical protein
MMPAQVGYLKAASRKLAPHPKVDSYPKDRPAAGTKAAGEMKCSLRLRDFGTISRAARKQAIALGNWRQAEKFRLGTLRIALPTPKARRLRRSAHRWPTAAASHSV